MLGLLRLLRDNVTLVPKAVRRVTPGGVVDSDGVERQVDAIILSTGFQAQNYLSTLTVTGRGGVIYMRSGTAARKRSSG